MYKSSRKWLCWVYLDTNKHFSLQKSTNLYRTPIKIISGSKSRSNFWWPKENCSGSKMIIFEKWQGYPTSWVWCRKMGNFQNMKNIAVFRLIFGFLVAQTNKLIFHSIRTKLYRTPMNFFLSKITFFNVEK